MQLLYAAVQRSAIELPVPFDLLVEDADSALSRLHDLAETHTGIFQSPEGERYVREHVGDQSTRPQTVQR